MNIYLAELDIPEQLIMARGLRAHADATVLEIAEVGANERIHLLEPAAAQAWRQLKAAAFNDGVDLWIVSAFRSIERQSEIVRKKLASGIAIEDILAVSAPPGFSEHHTGRAIDVSTTDSQPLEEEFDQTAAYAWLYEHASRFGYTLSYPVDNAYGYQYEPWHWCFSDNGITQV